MSTCPLRFFGVPDANALLPNLREIFSVVRPLRARFEETARALSRLGHPPQYPNLPVSDDAPDEVRRMQRRLQQLSQEIEHAIAPLAEVGAEVKAADGLVDFPSRREGELVYLCWQWGDDEIAHYHGEDAGFTGRAPIDDPDSFEGDLLN